MAWEGLDAVAAEERVPPGAVETATVYSAVLLRGAWPCHVQRVCIVGLGLGLQMRGGRFSL